MAIINGTSMTLLLNGTTVGHAQNCSITISNALRGITTKESAGFDESLGGLVSWSISGDGLFALTDTVNTVDLTTLLLAGTEATVRFTVVNTSDAQISLDEYWTGSVFVDNIDMTSPTEDNVSYSFNLKGSGELKNPVFT